MSIAVSNIFICRLTKNGIDLPSIGERHEPWQITFRKADASRRASNRRESVDGLDRSLFHLCLLFGFLLVLLPLCCSTSAFHFALSGFRTVSVYDFSL